MHMNRARAVRVENGCGAQARYRSSSPTAVRSEQAPSRRGLLANLRHEWLKTAIWALALPLLACVKEPAGDLLCQNPPKLCDCQAASDRGSVVVRWRLADSQVGQLLSRGDCCCMPDDAPPSQRAREQCANWGSHCPQSPAWLIRLIQLHITSVDTGETCVITAPCSDGELTTPSCFVPGLYDLQLSADIDTYDPGCAEFRCAYRQAITPPALRRRIAAGQTVNLDSIVLSVNAPPVFPSASDGGTANNRCLAPMDGSAHE